MSGWPMRMAQVEWHGLSALPMAVAIAASLLALVVWLYPRQVRSLNNPWRWLLPGLRGVALVVLALSLLKPVAVRSRQPEEAGAIVVIIDSSKSMGIVDTHRSNPELVRLADGLGLLPAGERPTTARQLPARMQEVRAQLDATARALGELHYAQLAGRDIGAAEQRLTHARQALRARLLDSHALSESLDDPTISERLSALADAAADPLQEQAVATLEKQFDAAVRAIDAAVRRIDQQVYKRSQAVRAVCETLRRQSRLQIVSDAMIREGSALREVGHEAMVFGFTIDDDLQPLPLHAGGRLVETLSIDPGGSRSRISSAVPRALERLGNRPVHAVVLLSDGRQVGGDERITSALFSGGVPVFAVLAAPERAVDDTAITGLQIPDALFVGLEAIVRVEVRVRGAHKGARTVRLHAGEQTQEQQVELNGDAPQMVMFPVVIEAAGIHDLRVEVEPQPGEASLDNNVAARRIKVLADRTRVIALAGTATWEFQYLRNLLQRSAWVELTDAIVPADAIVSLTPRDLFEADVVILSDVAAESLTAAQRDAIHRLVTERGGSVILVAGDAHLPEAWGDDVLLQALLPWRSGGQPSWRQWPGETAGFRPVPAAGAASADALRLGDDPDLNAAWNSLPPMYRILAMPELKPNAQALLVERDATLPLMTEARLGAGRVFFAAFNESWRWRYKSGDARHSRFWLQIVRHAAEAPYAIRNAQYAFDADALSIEPDQTVRVRAKRLEPSADPLYMRVVRDGETVTTRRLTQVHDDTRRFVDLLDPLQPGEYTLQLIAGDEPTWLTLPLAVRPTLEPELLDLSPDPALLRRLAESSGGMMLTLDGLHQLAPRLEQLTERRPRAVRQPLWDSPYLFGFVLGCLSLEWAMRKRLGLA